MSKGSSELTTRDGIILFLVIILLINARLPKKITEYIPEPVYITVEKESVNEVEVEVEKTVYIEVPIFIEVKPGEKKEVKEKEISYTTTEIKGSSGFKSYMNYTTITKKSSLQYKLQQWAHTDVQGFRIYEGRYICALGTGVGAKVGQFVDIILKNGTHIQAIVGDIKSDKDTDASNLFCSNGCCTEMIVDKSYLISAVKTSGDCSKAKAEWDSPVVAINVLDRNVF